MSKKNLLWLALVGVLAYILLRKFGNPFSAQKAAAARTGAVNTGSGGTIPDAYAGITDLFKKNADRSTADTIAAAIPLATNFWTAARGWFGATKAVKVAPGPAVSAATRKAVDDSLNTAIDNGVTLDTSGDGYVVSSDWTPDTSVDDFNTDAG